MTENIQAQIDQVEEVSAVPPFTVRVFPVNHPSGKLQANAQITVAGAFVVSGFRIFQGDRGLFVREPQQVFESNNTRRYSSIVQPITREAREAIFGNILSEYRAVAQRMGRSIQQQPEMETDVSDDDLPFEEDGPVMGM